MIIPIKKIITESYSYGPSKEIINFIDKHKRASDLYLKRKVSNAFKEANENIEFNKRLEQLKKEASRQQEKPLFKSRKIKPRTPTPYDKYLRKDKHDTTEIKA